MKATKPNPFVVQMLFIAACVILTVGRSAQAQTDGYLLMVQQSPLDAGIVTPQTGIYRTPLNDTITLTAVPNTGYRFVCWLGGVTEPTANSTTIVVDAPKIVIAVFEREEFETLSEEGLLVPGQGYTGLRRSPSSVRAGASVSPGEPKIYDTPDLPPRRQNGDDGQVDDFPVPDEGDDQFPVPEVPEPATLLILGPGVLGVLFTRKRFAR